ncbi:hypothetical protein QQP08_000664, partial [Theobroma cacao]
RWTTAVRCALTIWNGLPTAPVVTGKCAPPASCVYASSATMAVAASARLSPTSSSSLRIISDFSVLPSEVKEGRVGTYWYHEDTQAFLDDVDHYRIIKAMCRLSCSVCDKMEAQGAKRQGKFRNIEQLKGHLFHRHRLVMCGLCLEGRKVRLVE